MPVPVPRRSPFDGSPRAVAYLEATLKRGAFGGLARCFPYCAEYVKRLILGTSFQRDLCLLRRLLHLGPEKAEEPRKDDNEYQRDQAVKNVLDIIHRSIPPDRRINSFCNNNATESPFLQSHSTAMGQTFERAPCVGGHPIGAN